MKRLLILAAVLGVIMLTLSALFGVYLAPRLKDEMEQLLTDRTGRPVLIKSFDWSLWPALRFRGHGLSIGSSEDRNALFVYVKSLTVQAGLTGLLSSPRRIEFVNLEETLIRIPPRKQRSELQLEPVAFAAVQQEQGTAGPVILDRLTLKTAGIEILSRDPNKPPRIIQLRSLIMQGIALDKSSPFEADVRYPKPEGDVYVEGEFGPFHRDEPIATPISGEYTFKEADLGTFREIKGTLTSSGNFIGDLGENHVEGQAQIPDFQLTKVQNIVPLDVRFVVDRTRGNVYLKEVDTAFLETRLITTGAIKGTPRGRIVDLHVTGSEARVEDLLRIALKGDEPPLIGAIQLDTSVTVPPGTERVMQKMIVSGEFSIEEGEFTNEGFQKKLAQISKIGRSEKNQAEDDKTFSNLTGEFRLEKGVIKFSELHFGVPGMLVSLSGTYALESEQMDFSGRVELERSVSEMTSGRLSDWLRILDPILRRGNAGTSVPIRIKGTRSSPSVTPAF